MKTFVIVCWMILLIAAGGATAGDSPRNGLEFGLSSLGLNYMSPSKIDGYDLSWARRSSETRGWRIGMRARFDIEDPVHSQQRDVENHVASVDDQNIELGVSFQKVFVSRPRNDVSLVFGVGPTLSYANQEWENRDLASDGQVRQRRREQSRWAGGGVWDLGVEWSPVDQVTLGIRYRWRLLYGREESLLRDEDPGGVVTANQEEADVFILESQEKATLLATIWY